MMSITRWFWDGRVFIIVKISMAVSPFLSVPLQFSSHGEDHSLACQNVVKYFCYKSGKNQIINSVGW